ncbi:pyrroloquinoline quinone-dependent dehydrogenase [Sphingomonas nostoxanthinifaciens]|uniref:pyrroloquinoline quinone-dependent dehydrogenase n=1 Tax=Sphingomonas nostoxanthinifaciens TaxID=2872652 RepID=UPI001CC1DCD0|nr:pyrroloquinoline quinone-dependent dehydrogenase [Sphingomonas nostoxanthinifaciens]UAK24396.1 pyrroloquinoline quinone-dependent dehydrogenase [Sphingomonas nostoxanthinifaciens]
MGKARISLVAGLLVASCHSPAHYPHAGGPVDGWGKWGGDDGGLHYSANTQITPANVHDLKVAWTYRTGDLVTHGEKLGLAVEATPILVGDTLFMCSPRARISAVDAATGRQKWMYDAHPDTNGATVVTCRGVSYWEDKRPGASSLACGQRIFAGTIDGKLLALDARTGRPCADFGKSGQVNLHDRLGTIEQPGLYGVSSAPTIYGDLVITGSKIIDFHNTDMPGGVVRAFDARTGAERWAWTGAPPGTAATETGKDYPRSTPNVWGPMSVDVQHKLLFLPTGTPQIDMVMGAKDWDHFGSALIALDIETGALRWSYQFVHKDVWDYDTPSQPLLFDYKAPGGRIVPAVAQATKMGYIFVLDRMTGKPLMPVREMPVPQGGVQADQIAPTQPIPLLPEHPLQKMRLTEDDMWGFTPIDRHACVKKFRTLRNEGLFTPIGAQSTLVYPTSLGGMDWGGLSYDPQRNLLLVNSTSVPGILKLVPHAGSDGYSPLNGTPFRLVHEPFLSPFGAPCVRPPWGRLTAIDMGTGRRKWDVPLGTSRDMAPWPLWFKTGTPNQGGTTVTAGGLVFVGATTDQFIRAFSTETGKEVWRARLPVTAQATPMTYRLGPNGRQYVVISAGGHTSFKNKQGDYVIAYALPE